MKLHTISPLHLKSLLSNFLLTWMYVGARHCRKPLGRSMTASGFTKTRAFPTTSCQNISSSIGFTKTRAFPTTSCQNVSTFKVKSR